MQWCVGSTSATQRPGQPASGGVNRPAKAAGIAVRCSKQLTGANGRSLVEESEAGYVKLVCDEATGRVLGAQLACPRATDLVAEVALAIHLVATAADVAATIHPHPTVSEMIMEAAR